MTFKDLIAYALDHFASDIHLAVGHPPVLRVDGELRHIKGEKELTAKDVEAAISSILSPEQQKALASKVDVDLAYEANATRVRVNVHVARGRQSLAARLIPSIIPEMDEIGLTDKMKALTELPHGLILVTGPAGTGKSTTLASMINAINMAKSAHIITLEDPVEFLFAEGAAVVKQREIGSDVVSFQEGLRRVLRQDPDVIMVGEMRDPESIATTLTLAETGHLVFATLHTYSASQTVQRIIDSFPAAQQDQIRTQLALTLRAVIAQQLLPKVGGGRIAAREFMLNNTAIASLIRENKVAQMASVIQTGKSTGMFTLKQDLTRLLKEGRISEEAAAMLAMV